MESTDQVISDTFVVPKTEKKAAPATGEKYYRADREVVHDHVKGIDVVLFSLQLDSDLYPYTPEGNLSTTPLFSNKHRYLTSDTFADASSLQAFLVSRGKIPPYLEVKSVPGKGYGIFTKVKIAAGTYLGQYEGIVRPRTINKDNLYVFNVKNFEGVNGGAVVDGDNIFFSNWTRFINDGKNINITFDVLNYQVFVFAKTDISAGSELLGSYGDDYFKVHGITKVD